MLEWRRSSARALALGLLAVSSVHFAVSVHRAGAFGVVDFPIFLERARVFRDTGVLYPAAEDPAVYAPAAAVYKFPPPYAMLLLPFTTRADEHRVLSGHRVVQVAAYLLAVGLLLHALAPRRPSAFWLLGLALALNFEPFFETLWRLQIETGLLLLLAIGVVALARERDGPLGAAIAAGALLKIYPAVLAAYLVAGRRWRALAALAVTAALIGVSSWIVIGGAENRSYWLRVFPALLAELPAATTENVSPARYLQTLSGLGPATAKRAATILAGCLLVVSAWAVRWRAGRSTSAAHARLAFALFVPAMLLSMPNGWVNYQLLLLVPLLALLAHATSESRDRTWVGWTIGAAVVPLLFYQPCAPPEQGWPCAATPPFLGLVELPRAIHDAFVALRGLSAPIVWVALLAVIVRSRAVPSREGEGGDGTAPPPR